MCYVSGNIVLLPLPTPREPIQSLLAGQTGDSKLFLRKTRDFTSYFPIMSFGTTKIYDLTSDEHNFEVTFKIQDQVYHNTESLMSMFIVVT